MEKTALITEIAADRIVQPVMQAGFVQGRPGAVDAVDRVVRRQVLPGCCVRIEIRDPEGMVLYSDEPRLVGERFALGDEELEVLRDDVPATTVSNPDDPQNRYERDDAELLEASAPITGPGDETLVLTAYFDAADVQKFGRSIWLDVAPTALGGLVLLHLLQLPLARTLVGRVRDLHRERERLLTRSLESMDEERRRLVRDLHDGVVQNLAGVHYRLDAAARATDVPPQLGAVLAEASEEVRAGVRSLRSLLVEVYPPDLGDAGLLSALDELVRRVRADGVTGIVVSDVDLDDGEVAPTDVVVLYRVAQEALRNVARHASARHVMVVLTQHVGGLELTVEDDGVGFDDAVLDADRHGHLGLRGLADLVAEHGGSFDVRSTPGRGTTVRAGLHR